MSNLWDEAFRELQRQHAAAYPELGAAGAQRMLGHIFLFRTIVDIDWPAFFLTIRHRDLCVWEITLIINEDDDARPIYPRWPRFSIVKSVLEPGIAFGFGWGNHAAQLELS